jgi:hypothetical protein
MEQKLAQIALVIATLALRRAEMINAKVQKIATLAKKIVKNANQSRLAEIKLVTEQKLAQTARVTAENVNLFVETKFVMEQKPAQLASKIAISANPFVETKFVIRERIAKPVQQIVNASWNQVAETGLAPGKRLVKTA